MQWTCSVLKCQNGYELFVINNNNMWECTGQKVPLSTQALTYEKLIKMYVQVGRKEIIIKDRVLAGKDTEICHD